MTRQENFKITIANLIEDLIEVESYYKTRVFIIVDNDIILKISELRKISFIEMKRLEKYKLVRWSNDFVIDRNDNEIRTLVIIGK